MLRLSADAATPDLYNIKHTARVLSLLYGFVMSVRNRLFDLGVLRSHRFPLAVIGVGNLAVGGTGKTPHTEYLLRHLLAAGQRAGMLSRGYGRRTLGFREVTDCTADEAGDEPLQVKRKYPAAYVCVCEDRVAGIRRMLRERPDLQAIVLDDAYQHRYVTPSLNILLTDFSRPYYADRVLPTGRLRERAVGARRADIIVVTKCPPTLDEAARQDILQRLQPEARQTVFFSSLRYGALRPFEEEAVAPEDDEPTLQGKRLLLLTGIARPEPLLQHLQATGAEVEMAAFADHHRFSKAEISRLGVRAAGFDLVVTTEKDAARLSSLALPVSLRERLWLCPVEIYFLFGDDCRFRQKVFESTQQS